MKNNVIGMNPQILYWAREKAGYSLEEVARSFGKKDLLYQSNRKKEMPSYRTFLFLTQRSIAIAG